MAAKKTNYKEQIDTNGEYEVHPELPPEESAPDAVNCCDCDKSSNSICLTEQSAGAYVTAAAAQTFVFWSV